MNWVIRDFSALTSMELYQIIQLRINVFMLEQDCLYPECDDKDIVGKHLFAVEDSQVVAYARLLPPQVSYADPSIGRVVVRKDKRSQKLGMVLMQKAIESVYADFPNENIRISAQSHLQKFYEDLGFEAEGEEYLEDDISHIEMALYR